MKVRIVGSLGEIDKVVAALRTAGFEIVDVSAPMVWDDDSRQSRVYLDIFSESQKLVCGAPEPFQVIEFCQVWHSKAEVMHEFRISWGKAEEILERLVSDGSLQKVLEKRGRTTSRYLYKVNDGN